MNKNFKTLYQHWNEGSLSNFGSFQTYILKAYRVADSGNMRKLEEAFPEWFLKKFEYTPYHFITENSQS
ncbi:MAG: hypothetical protein ACTHJN_20280 [Ginsengibacter sp.]